MIYQYRLSKYNPRFRDELGKYKNINEWTGFDIVGKMYKGKLFTLKNYLLVENDYLSAIEEALLKNKVQSMIMAEIEVYPTERKKVFGFREKESAPLNLIFEISRLILRDEMWCKFHSGDIYLHFGYDMYVYFSSKKKLIGGDLEFKKVGNVYLEEFASPYLKN